jgi:hypothetical protein
LIFVKDGADNKLHSVASADDNIFVEYFVLLLHHLSVVFCTILLGHCLGFVVFTGELIQETLTLLYLIFLCVVLLV